MKKKITVPFIILNIFFLVQVSVHAKPLQSSPLKSSIEIQTKTHQAAAASQKKINQASEETERLLVEYRDILRREESLRLYNDQLEKMTSSQKKEIASFEGQLREIEVTQREILPLILRMIERLEQFVGLDLPFLMEDRQAQIASLREMVNRPDLTIAEKYRKVVEAYQLEMEYGRTIEAGTGVLNQKGKSRTVQLLRLGRIGLMYLTPDGKEAGYWDTKKGKWEQLPDDYRPSIRQGLRIARKETAPDLLKVPIMAAEGRK
ncbi:MAG: DUF3450 domain-containing protein [Nitrospiria bacterium]